MPQDLYTHLTEVFNRILMHHADDAYDRFEEISALVKQTDLKFKDPKNDFELNAAMSAKAVSEREQWVERSRNLLNEVNDLISSGDKSLLTKDKTFTIPNFAEEAEMLELLGGPSSPGKHEQMHAFDNHPKQQHKPAQVDRQMIYDARDLVPVRLGSANDQAILTTKKQSSKLSAASNPDDARRKTKNQKMTSRAKSGLKAININLNPKESPGRGAQ